MLELQNISFRVEGDGGDLEIIDDVSFTLRDGQFLVMHDLLGLNTGHVPSFARKFADLGQAAIDGFAAYAAAVMDGSFPPPRPARTQERT